jgi:hypothetical protein
MFVTAEGNVQVINGDKKDIEFGWSSGERECAQANKD